MANKNSKTEPAPVVLLVLAWAWVGIPLVWGLMQTISKAAALFQ